LSEVLLTYGWVRSSYAALRNLSKHDLSVAVSDTSKLGMCQFSRLHDGFFKYTSHYENEDKFISDLVKICEQGNIKLILPVHNETEIIARHREKFNPSIMACVPNHELCELFNNKKASYELVEKLNIPVPVRIKYNDPKEVPIKLHEQGFTRSVIKLLTGNSGKGVFYAATPEEAQQIVENLIYKFDLKKSRFPQVEEYIEGDGFGVSVLYWDGECIVDFSHKRLRDKVTTGGTSTLREMTSNPYIKQAALKLFNHVGWHGLAMCEFKVCSETGKFWFIEVNPRMWGSIPLAIAAGVEFPYLAWMCAKMGPKEAKEYHRRAILADHWRARWLLGDLFVFLQKCGKLQFKEAIKILVKTKSDSLDDFYIDDPLPFFGELFIYLKKIIYKRSLNPSEDGMVR